MDISIYIYVTVCVFRIMQLCMCSSMMAGNLPECHLSWLHLHVKAATMSFALMSAAYEKCSETNFKVSVILCGEGG